MPSNDGYVIRSIGYRYKKGNWYEGLRQLQAIMFNTNHFTLEQCIKYFENAIRYTGCGWKKLKPLKFKPRILKRKDITYYHFQIADVKDQAFRDYKVEYTPQLGVIEITAVNWLDT